MGFDMSNNTFFIDQPVRVTDLNYGAHVGITQMHGMAHSARFSLLASHGLTELDVGGVGLMAVESNIKLSAESFPGAILRFFVDIEIVSKTKFKCIVRVFNNETNQHVATIEDLMICFDYERKRPAAIPETFKALFRKEAP